MGFHPGFKIGRKSPLGQRGGVSGGKAKHGKKEKRSKRPHKPRGGKGERAANTEKDGTP